MKAVYILLVIVVIAAALGCVGKNGPETIAKTPATTITPAPTSLPSTTVAETEVLDPGNDLATMETMVDEMSLDLSFSDVSVDTLT